MDVGFGTFLNFVMFDLLEKLAKRIPYLKMNSGNYYDQQGKLRVTSYVF